MRGSYLSLLVRLSVVDRKFSFVVGRSRDWVREREGGREGGRARETEREREREREREGGRERKITLLFRCWLGLRLVERGGRERKKNPER